MIFKVVNGCFSYGAKEILKNVSLEVLPGEVTSVLGPNGIGKTTLLRCMMGLLRWKSGHSEMDGRDIRAMKPAEIWKNMSYVPQAKSSTQAYTALDMVILGRSAHLRTLEQPKKKDVEAAKLAMEEVRISHLRDKRCDKMSGGELQMVLIARALASEPRLLVLDEPESNLDFKNQLIILETIQRLAKKHDISIVLNTHYPAHALKVADKALLLDRGGRYDYGLASEIINERNMRKSFLVRVSIHDFAVDGKRYNTVVPLAIIN